MRRDLSAHSLVQLFSLLEQDVSGGGAHIDELDLLFQDEGDLSNQWLGKHTVQLVPHIHGAGGVPNGGAVPATEPSPSRLVSAAETLVLVGWCGLLQGHSSSQMWPRSAGGLPVEEERGG